MNLYFNERPKNHDCLVCRGSGTVSRPWDEETAQAARERKEQNLPWSHLLDKLKQTCPACNGLGKVTVDEFMKQSEEQERAWQQEKKATEEWLAREYKEVCERIAQRERDCVST